MVQKGLCFLKKGDVLYKFMSRPVENSEMPELGRMACGVNMAGFIDYTESLSCYCTMVHTSHRPSPLPNPRSRRIASTKTHFPDHISVSPI